MVRKMICGNINQVDNMEEGKYIIGLKDGIWKSYYPDGKLRFKGNFSQGNPDGQYNLLL